MTIRNPCDEVQPDEPTPQILICPPGFIRVVDANGAQQCVNPADIVSFEEPPDSPEELANPFAENVFFQPQRNYSFDFLPNLNFFQAPQEQAPLIPLSGDLEYVSATRDLTTIDENSFYDLSFIQSDISVDQRLEFFRANHSSIWLNQKTDQSVLNSVDRFRLALFNFWNFQNYYEEITAKSCGNFRTSNNPPIPSIGPLSMNLMLEFQPAEYEKRTRFENGNRFRWRGYNSWESTAFRFSKGLLDFTAFIMPGNTPKSHAMDIYMFGSDSIVWEQEGRSWDQAPITREHFRHKNIEFDKEFYDFVFDSPAAFYESEMDNILVSPFDSANVVSNITNHELRSSMSSELLVPSVYQYYQAQQTDKLISNGSLLAENLPNGLVEFNQKTVSSYEQASTRNEESSAVLKFPSNKVEMFEEINKTMKGALTNYIEITINSTQATPINSALQRNKMDTLILQLLQEEGEEYWSGIENLMISGKIKDRKFTKILDDQFIQADSLEVSNQTINDKAVQGINERIIINIDKILSLSTNDYLSVDGQGVSQVFQHDRQSELFWPRDLSEYPLYYTGWDNHQLAKMEELIRSQIFLAELEQIIEEGRLQRSYADLLNGQKAYAEVIGYKVEKYKITKNEAGQEIENKIQDFYFMNNDAVEKIEYLDTQVIPGAKYTYKMYTMNIVIGTKYMYAAADNAFEWRFPGAQEVRPNANEQNLLRFNIASNRLISLIEAPFFQKTVVGIDRPPMTPDVSFLPYQGVDNRYSVLLKTAFGEQKEKPIPVLQEDEDTLPELYRNQNIRQGEEILYKTDSLPTHFEVMRIDTPPETYRDFDSAETFHIRKPAAGNTCFIKFTDIEPNKFYYYIFRTVDKAGVSNPTEVFRVRMISYEEGIFMEMDTYEMYKKPENFNMSFEAALKISPNFEQKIIDFDKALNEIQSNTPSSALSRIREELGLRTKADLKKFQRRAPRKDQLKLGKVPAAKSIWSKKFKFRCTSKKTGKKIDFNIVFSQKKTEKLSKNSITIQPARGLTDVGLSPSINEREVRNPSAPRSLTGVNAGRLPGLNSDDEY